MNFVTPFAFLFALSLPAVVALYMLKRRRTVHVVSSSLLWRKFLSETQANAPFQKLRNNLLMILQLLLLAFVVFALARPYFEGEQAEASLKVLIIDSSASMQSTDVKPSRFEEARRQALDWVGGKKDGEQMIVLESAGRTVVRQSETSNKASLRRAIESMRATDGPTRIAETLQLAESLIQNRPGAEVHLFSDGAFGDLLELDNHSLPLVYHRVGEVGNNAGIVSLDIRSNPENQAQRAVFANLMNHSTGAIGGELELYFEDQLLEVQPVALAPTNSAAKVFLVEQPADGVLSVRLNIDDDLASDNEASMVSILPKPVKVLLVSPGNSFLARALQSAELVELSVTSQFTGGEEDFDVVVLDGVVPSVWPSVNTLAIGVAGPDWFADSGVVEAPLVVKWQSSHPLMRYVNFDGVLIAESRRVQTPPWGQAIVESSQNPLIVAGERGRQRVLWIGFDTLQSNWPKRISFPIFIANAVEWLNPEAQRARQLTIQSGQPLRYTPDEVVTVAEIVDPTGATREISVSPDSPEIVFGNTDLKGVYQLAHGGKTTRFVVNSIDSAESNTGPSSEVVFGEYSRTEASTLKKASVEYWRWLALAAFAILMFEWWYYHKRTA